MESVEVRGGGGLVNVPAGQLANVIIVYGAYK